MHVAGIRQMKRNWKNAGGKCVDELKRKQKEGDQEGDRKGKIGRAHV